MSFGTNTTAGTININATANANPASNNAKLQRVLTTQAIVTTSPFDGVAGLTEGPIPHTNLLDTQSALVVFLPSNMPPTSVSNGQGGMVLTPIGVALRRHLKQNYSKKPIRVLPYRLSMTDQDKALAIEAVSRITANGNAAPASLPRPHRMSIGLPVQNAGEIATGMPAPATSCTVVLYGATNDASFLGAQTAPIATLYLSIELLPIAQTAILPGQLPKAYTAVATATMVTTVVPGNQAIVEAMLHVATNATTALRALAIQQELDLPTDELTWNPTKVQDRVNRRALLESKVDNYVAFEMSPQTIDTVTVTGEETLMTSSGSINVWTEYAYSAYSGEYITTNNAPGNASMITPTTMVRKLAGQEDAMVELMAAYMTPGNGGVTAMQTFLNNVLAVQITTLNVVDIAPRLQIARSAIYAWGASVTPVTLEISPQLNIQLAPQQYYYVVG